MRSQLSVAILSFLFIFHFKAAPIRQCRIIYTVDNETTTFWPQASTNVKRLTFAFKSKSNLHYTRGIKPKRVTSGGAHLRILAPGLHGYEGTLQRWRAVGDTVPIWPTRDLYPRPPPPIACALSNWANSRSNSPFAIVFSVFLVFSCIFILLSRESDQSVVTSLLRSCRPSVYHIKMGESRSVPFPTAHYVNLPACSPHCPFNAERQAAGKQWIPILKSCWFKPTRNQTWVFSSRGVRSYHSAIWALSHLIFVCHFHLRSFCLTGQSCKESIGQVNVVLHFKLPLWVCYIPPHLEVRWFTLQYTGWPKNNEPQFYLF